MIWLILLSLYCGAMWSLAIFAAVGESRLDFIDVLQIIFAPVFIPLALIFGR